MTNSGRCSCGAREKNKCIKESERGCGKMCLKTFDLPEEYVFPERMKTFTPDDWIKEWESKNGTH